MFLIKLRHPGTIAFLFSLLVAFIVVVGSPLGSTLNAVFIAVLTAIFLVCVGMIPHKELGDFYRFSLWVMVFAFFLHSWYELLHSALYEDWTTYN